MRTKIEEIIDAHLDDRYSLVTDLAALTKQTAIAYHLWRGSQPPGQLPKNVDLYDYWMKEVKGE